MGGDEFLLMAQNIISSQDINHILHRIIDANSRPIIFKNNKFQVNLSIGISNYPNDGEDLKKLYPILPEIIKR